MPKPRVAGAFITLAARITDQLQGEAPGRLEIDPRQPRTRPFAAMDRFAQHFHPPGPEVGERGVEIIHIESNMMPAPVAVSGQGLMLFGSAVFEELEVQAGAATE